MIMLPGKCNTDALRRLITQRKRRHANRGIMSSDPVVTDRKVRVLLDTARPSRESDGDQGSCRSSWCFPAELR
jgi:hypothetical protein